MKVLQSSTAKFILSQKLSHYNQYKTPILQSVRQLSEQNSNARLFPEDLNIIYDGKCNVCKLEMDFLSKRDAHKVNIGAPKLKLTDLEDAYDENDPANGGVSYKEGMKAIHAITAEGKVIKGVPVFLMAYEQVNLGWLFRVTTWPVVKQIVEMGYIIFAKYRTNLTRGASVDTLVEQYERRREMLKKMQNSCDENRCSTNP